MAYQRFEPLSKQVTIVIGLTVVGFMAFGLALSFYRNVLFDSTLVTIEQQNMRLQKQIEDGHALLDYYQSAQYKDKYAKENLNKLNAGEKVLVITQATPLNPFATTQSGALTASQEALYQEHLREIPIYLHWELYLFERGRLEELRKQL